MQSFPVTKSLTQEKTGTKNKQVDIEPTHVS